ncbi:hypothetical protein Leryth_010949 [Lithospermum erythrorhizon]|uniref:Uncharacterized protein n=1 Tax=Lithospermum erythrorhizon TaxID=34254 RepID=A0AAV3Q1S4_LITER|nr:hypothetical protein Leryth_010949 [Lithospermum erythrorhizon]
MASARIARFVSEVAPPQFVKVMRQRTSKMLDTIKEDEREAFYTNDHHFFSTKTSSNSSKASSTTASSSSSSKYIIKDVEKSLPHIFGK